MPAASSKNLHGAVLCGAFFIYAGTYVANRASDKITMITDNVWMCRSGSVSMCSPRGIFAFSFLLGLGLRVCGVSLCL